MNRSRVTGDLASHGNIFVDITNDRVGIGSTIPAEKLDIRGTSRLGGFVELSDSVRVGDQHVSQTISSNQGVRINRSGSRPCAVTFDHGGSPTLELGCNTTEAIIGSNNNLSKSLVIKTGMTLGTLTGGTTRLEFRSNGDIRMPVDNQKLQLGADQDLQIYHSGAQSVIKDSGTGGLSVFSNNFQVFNAAENEYLLTATEDGSVALYHNGSKKFETNSIGVDITGTCTDDGARHDGDVYFIGGTSGRNAVWDMSDNALEFADNAIAKFGSSDDLEIFHDGGTLNFIRSNNGKLVLRSDTFQFGTQDGAHRYIDIPDDEQGVSLFYDNVQRLATTSSGVSVTGNITATGTITSNDITIQDQQPRLNFVDNAGSPNDPDYLFQVDGGNFVLHDSTNGADKIKVNPDGHIDIFPNTDFAAGIDVAGTSTFDEDITLTGANYNVIWDKSNNWIQFHDNAKVRFGTSGDMLLYHDGVDNHIDVNQTLSIKTGGESSAQFDVNGSVHLYHDNSRKFQTTSSGATVTGQLLASSGFKVNDGVHITLGTDNDFKFYHDGSNAAWLNTTGNNYLYGSGGNFFIRPVNGESSIDAIANGAVNLYHDGTKKFETTSAGGTLTGNLSVTGTSSFSGDATFSGGGGAITIAANSDIEFGNGTWTGNTVKIQHHNNYLYLVGGSNGLVFREGGSDRWIIDGDGHFRPSPDSTHDIGTTSVRVRNGYFDTLYGDGSNLTGITQTTINSNADNRIITGSGTANTLNAESTLTFSDRLTVNITPNQKILLQGSTHPYIHFFEGTTGKAYVQWHADGYFRFRNDETGLEFRLGGSGVELLDSTQFCCGDSNDLRIFHDGNRSAINNATNELRILSGGDVIIGKRSGSDSSYSEQFATFKVDGAVELYHNNSKKLETTSSGVTVTGDLNFGNSSSYDIQLQGGKIYGDDSALPTFTIQNTSGNTNHCKITLGESVGADNGGITFYTAGASSSTARMRIRGNNNFIDILSSYVLRFNDGALNISHDGSHGYVTAATGILHLRSDSSIRLQDESGNPMLYAIDGGAVELYHNGGTKKFETTSKGAYINDNFLGVNVTAPTGSADGRNAFLALGDSDTGVAQNGDGQLELWANNQELMNLDTSNITSYKNIIPSANNTHDLGTTSNRWRNIYSADLQLSNEAKKDEGGNDVDGTWGDWTLQEGEGDVFMINNRNGKKFRIKMEEVS